MSPFDLELEGVGCFPPRGPAKVVWVGCGVGREALVALAEAISRALASRGFPGDTRPFSPHLTLARARNRRGSSAVAAAVRRGAFAAGPLGRVRVDRLLLVQSTLGSGPPRHDVLGTFPLAVLTASGGCAKARAEIDHAAWTFARTSSRTSTALST